MDLDVAVKVVRAIDAEASYFSPHCRFVRAGLVFPTWLYDRVACVTRIDVIIDFEFAIFHWACA
jgi:hypothetical protein